MPFSGFKDFGDCLQQMQDRGYDLEAAQKICGSLKHRAEDKKPQKKDEGDSMAAVAQRELEKAVWTRAQINDLPDSAFLYVAPGGRKDAEGKTVPRGLRYFPYKDKSGKVDLPHLRNAIARIPQSKAPGLSDAKKKQLQAKARQLLAQAAKKSDESCHACKELATVGAVWSSDDEPQSTFYVPACAEHLELAKEAVENSGGAVEGVEAFETPGVVPWATQTLRGLKVEDPIGVLRALHKGEGVTVALDETAALPEDPAFFLIDAVAPEVHGVVGLQPTEKANEGELVLLRSYVAPVTLREAPAGELFTPVVDLATERVRKFSTAAFPARRVPAVVEKYCCTSCGECAEFDKLFEKRSVKIVGGKGAVVRKNSDGTEERYVLGVVLEPDVVDAQSDTYDEETVRKSAHQYMEFFQKRGVMHRKIVGDDQIRILESYLAPVDFDVNGEKVRKGTWLLAARIVADDLWAKVRNGEFTGWSIGGSAIREPIEGT